MADIVKHPISHLKKHLKHTDMAPTIPSTMKAAHLVEFNSKTGIQVKQIPVPTLGPNDALVKIGAAGWCHTDYQVWEGTYESPLPIVPSHEPAGTVVALGPQAQAEGKWKIGDRVGIILFRHACKHCAGCEVTGDIRFCEKGDFAGLKGDGGMAEYAIGDAANMVRVPDKIGFVQAAPLMCAGATVYAGIQATNVQPGQAVGIIGIGGLGTLGVQFAKALGHPVVAIDNRPEGRELATAFKHKADLVIDPADPGAIDKIKQFSKAGLPALVGCTDNVEINSWALKLLRPNAKFVPLGLHVDGFRFNSFTLIFQQISVVGSVVATQAQAQEMLDIAAKHDVQSWITEVPLDRAGEMPQLYMNPHLKGRLVVKVSDE